MPVTASYVSAGGADEYPPPQWALTVYFCTVGNPAPNNPPSCNASNDFKLMTANGPNGTFAVDAVDTPNFPSSPVDALLPTGSGNPYGGYTRRRARLRSGPSARRPQW